MVETTSDAEVEGPLVYVIHAVWNDTDVAYDRTVLSLCTKDDLSFSVDEDDESVELSSERRSRRYRTHNTADLEVASVLDVDMEAAELIGVVDSDGSVTFDSDARRITADGDQEEHIELAYATEEGLTDILNAELVHRFSDLELTSPEIDPSATPPLLSWTWWVEGDIQLAYDASTE